MPRAPNCLQGGSKPVLERYTDPAEVRKHGYIFDGPSDDGTAFYYTGHGPAGGQELKADNSAIDEHG